MFPHCTSNVGCNHWEHHWVNMLSKSFQYPTLVKHWMGTSLLLLREAKCELPLGPQNRKFLLINQPLRVE